MRNLKKIIKNKDIDSMYFAGPNDKNIKLIEKNFKSNIVLRGNELLIDGTKQEIIELEKLVHNMIYTITKKKGHRHLIKNAYQLIVKYWRNYG